MSSTPVLLTTAAVAERWDVSVRLVQKLAATGELTSVRLTGRAVRIPLTAVEAYERGHTRRAGQPRTA